MDCTFNCISTMFLFNKSFFAAHYLQNIKITSRVVRDTAMRHCLWATKNIKRIILLKFMAENIVRNFLCYMWLSTLRSTVNFILMDPIHWRSFFLSFHPYLTFPATWGFPGLGGGLRINFRVKKILSTGI